jgi:cytochrome P450
VLDIAEETTDLALDVLERTIFSAGLFVGRDDLRAAMRTYFDGLGRIDPFDLFDLPDFIPRISRLSTRPRVFHQAVDMIAARERDLERHETGAANDVLMLLIRARDPATGGKLTRQDIRANVITFIAAGHESTANAITWTLYLLSRSTEWRECVRSEAERAGGETPELLFDRLSKTRAVVEESLRLYPPLAAISRMARSSDELAGMRDSRDRALCIASAQNVGNEGRRIRSGTISAGLTRIHRSICVPAVRRRRARLHRLHFSPFRRQRSRWPPLRGISNSKRSRITSSGLSTA